MTRTFLGTAAFAAGAAVFALTLDAPAPAQTPAAGAPVAITGARIIDGTGRAPIDNGTLVIANGRVSAVGPAASVTIPAGAQRVDATGKTIVPGFVNAHAHLNVEDGATLPVRDDLIRRLKTYAMYGVTTAVSLGSTDADQAEGIALMHEQDRVRLDRARMYSTGNPIVAKTPEQARTIVDRLADLKVHAIKFRLNGVPADMNEPTWSAVIDEAHKRGLKVAVHVYYLKDAKATIDKGVDIIAHSIRDQDVPPALIAEMKQKHVPYIPTLTRDLSIFVYETTPDFLNEPFFQRGMPLYKENVAIVRSPEYQDKVRKSPATAQIKKAIVQGERNLKLLNDAGITIAMGTDSGAAADPGRWQGYFEHVEMEMMNKSGMTPMQVLVASTSTAARIFGLEQVGTLQPGKLADLVVLRSNPLENIRNTRTIDSVWIAGVRLADVPPAPSTK